MTTVLAFTSDPPVGGGASTYPDAISVSAGMGMVQKIDLTEFADGDTISAVSVISQPDMGHIHIDSDLQPIIDMVAEWPKTVPQTCQLSVQKDGEVAQTVTVTINAFVGTCGEGHGPGDHAYLPIDPITRLSIVEPAPTHMSLFVTLDPNNGAMTHAEIQAETGKFTNKALFGFIYNQVVTRTPNYYGSRSKPLLCTGTIAKTYFQQLSARGLTLHVYFEGGYDYTGFLGLLGGSGYSELHPLLVDVWGTGEAKMNKELSEAPGPSNQDQPSQFHRVIRHITPESVGMGGTGNVIYEALGQGDSLEDAVVGAFGCQVQDSIPLFQDTVINEISDSDETFHPARLPVSNTRATYRLIKAFGLFRPTGGKSFWSHPALARGVMWDECHMDEIAWDRNFSVDPGGVITSAAPFNQSHLNYTNADCRDVTVRNSIFVRSPGGGGFQNRGGVYMYDCHFGECYYPTNNAGGGSSGFDQTPPILGGNYSSFWDIVDTSKGGFTRPNWTKEPAPIPWGNDADRTSRIRVTGTLRWNPADAAEMADKQNWDKAFLSDTHKDVVGWRSYDEQVVSYKVQNNRADDIGVAGLNTAVLDTKTAAKIIGGLAGNDGSWNTYAAYDWLRDNFPITSSATVRDFNRLFTDAFNNSPPADPTSGRTGGVSVAPIPYDELPMEYPFAMRYSARRMWGDEIPPGILFSDEPANLVGARVRFDLSDAHVPSLNLGHMGEFYVQTGKFIADDMSSVTTGIVKTYPFGQFFCGGWNDASNAIEIQCLGGRFANTGTFVSNGDITITGSLAASQNRCEFLFGIAGGESFTVSAGDTLEIVGPGPRVGVDGQSGTIALTINGTLTLVADGSVLPSAIQEFYSGIYGLDADDFPLLPSVTFNVTLGGASELEVDVTGVAPATYDLIVADSLTGTFAGGVTVTGGSATVDYSVSGKVRLIVS